MVEINKYQKYDRFTRRFFLYGMYGLFAFMLYASLLPYNFVPSPLGPSLHSFIQTLQFSQSEADQGQWIAHVIFNVLLSYFAFSYCYIKGRKKTWFVVILSIIFFGFLIEYLQMFIGSRGTAMVDVYANFSGMLIGFICWSIFGKYTLNVVSYIRHERKLPINAVKNLYLAFVIIILLFPFDFFINGDQINSAFALKGFPLFENNPEGDIGIISIFSSILLLLPMGILYRLSFFKESKSHSKVFIKIAIFLLLMEVLQFFEVSGQSSLLSFLLKLVGFIFGYYIGGYLSLTYMVSLIIKYRNLIFLSFPIFLLLVLKVKGVAFSMMATSFEVQNILKTMSFLPFDYYVDVGSAEALLSFLLNFIIYLPIGVYLALFHITRDKPKLLRMPKLATISILCAFIVEAIVLVWGLRRPDVTNLLIATWALPMGYFSFLMICDAALGLEEY